MSDIFLLRLSSFLLVFHTAGHTYGMLTWRETDDTTKAHIIAQMDQYRFPFMGVSNSLGEYYDGMSMLFSVFLFTFAFILQISTHHNNAYVATSSSPSSSSSSSSTKDHPFYVLPYLVGPVYTPICLALFILSYVEFLYFFPFAATVTLLSAISLLLAIIRILGPCQAKKSRKTN